MNLWKNNLFFIGVLVGCLSFSFTPVVHGFITGASGGLLHEHKFLISDIFQPEWKIRYRYGVDCQPEDRQNGEELKEAMSAALRTWLEPIKELQLGRPIVDKFVYELRPDCDPDQPVDFAQLLEQQRGENLRVTFECTKGRSIAGIGVFSAPEVIMRMGTKITPEILTVLVHEIGHAFGLADTYAREFAPSSGGLRQTAGKQPASVMAVFRYDNPLTIGEDDKRCLIWLYRFFHDKQEIEDCFFADYVYIKDLDTCRPKHPLIFEVKHNPSKHTLQILKDDPNLDVNAQDVSGMTALHYAVMYEKVEVVEALLAHEKIKPLIKNKQGHTPLDIAHETAITTRLVAMFPKNEPSKPSLDVAPGTNLTTTWGAIKQR